MRKFARKVAYLLVFLSVCVCAWGTTPRYDAILQKLRDYNCVVDSGLNAAKPAAGAVGRFFYCTDTAILWFDNGTAWVDVTGSVSGPATSTDNALVRWNGTTGKLIQDNAYWILDDSGNLVFEGTANDFETTFSVTDPTTPDKVITFQDATGTVVIDGTACSDIEGTALTITAGVLNVDDVFLANSGDTGTGTYDFTGAVLAGASPLVFDGATAGTSATTLTVTDPSAANVITLQNATGTLVLHSAAVTDVAGDHLSVGTTTLNVDDDFLLNNGDTGTGNYDFTGAILLGATPLVFEGATDDDYQLNFAVTDITTPDKTVTWQNASGTVVLHSAAVTDVAGDHLTVGTTTLNVDDDWVDETGDTMTGALTITHADGLKTGVGGANDDDLKLAIGSTGAAKFVGTITATDLTATRTWTFPNVTGTIPIQATGRTADETGDIIYRDSTMTFENLAHGTVGQLLQTGGHDAYPSWVTATLATITAGGATTTDDLTVGNILTVKFDDNAYATLTQADAGALTVDVTSDGTAEVLFADPVQLGLNGADGQLKIFTDDAGGDGAITINPPSGASITYTLTLPTSDGGANEFLQTNGSGALTWATALTTTPGLTAVSAVDATSAQSFTLKGATPLALGEDVAGGTTNVPGWLKFWSNGDNAFSSTFTAGTQTADAAYTLPTALPAGSSKFLQSTTGGVLSWETAAAGTIGGSTGGVDNMLTRADGAGGSTIQATSVEVDDSNNLTFPDPGTTAASPYIKFQADQATTLFESTIQMQNGTDPYLRISVDSDAGTLTPIMDFHDTVVSLGNGTAGVDYQLVFNGEDADGTITWQEDEATFDMACKLTVSQAIQSGKNGGDGSFVLFSDDAGGDATITIQPPAASETYTLTLPTTDGAENQFLQTNGSGALTWATALTAEADTLATVTARGATTDTATKFNGYLLSEYGMIFTGATTDLGPNNPVGEVDTTALTITSGGQSTMNTASGAFHLHTGMAGDGWNIAGWNSGAIEITTGKGGDNGGTPAAGGNSGNITMDAGAPGTGTPNGTAGTITIGGTNAESVTIGRATKTTSVLGLADLSAAVLSGASPLVFEGATGNEFETTLTITDPTADRAIAVPDAGGTMAVSATTPATLSAAGDIGVTVAKDIVAGVGLSGGADDVLPGADADVTVTFAPAELGAMTWGTGAEASFIWGFDVSGTDTGITFGNGIVNVSTGALQVGGAAVLTAVPDNYVLTAGDTMTGALQISHIDGVTAHSAVATDDAIKLAVTTGGAAKKTGNITATDLTDNRTWTMPNLTGSVLVDTAENAGNAIILGTLNLGKDDDTSTLTIHDAGTQVFWNDSDTESVTFGPVDAVAPILAVTGTINATGLQVGGTNVLTAEVDGSTTNELPTAGLAIDVSGQQVAFDPTELLGDRTWGDGTTDTITWTWDRNTGTDVTMQIVSGKANFNGLQVGGVNVFTEGGGQINGSLSIANGITVYSSTATNDSLLLSSGLAGAAKYDGTIYPVDLTAARFWTLPDLTGTVLVDTANNAGNVVLLGTLDLGKSDDTSTLTLHNAATIVMKDAGDTADKLVTIGPVADGTTTLGVTGTINATGLQVGGTAVLTAADVAKLNFAEATELTIASNAVTITQSVHKVDTESDIADDDLDTISGGTAGDFLVLYLANDTRAVWLTDAGNIDTPDSLHYPIPSGTGATLYFDGTNWRLLSCGTFALTHDHTQTLYSGQTAAQINALIAQYPRDLGGYALTFQFNSVDDTIDNAAAVDKGGGLVGIPVTGHTFTTNDRVTIAGSTNYNSTYAVVSETADEVVITETYQVETFAGTETIVSGGYNNTMTSALLFSGFRNGTLNVYGNTGEANAGVLHATQSVFLDFSGGTSSGIRIVDCDAKSVLIRNLHVKVADAAVYPVEFTQCRGYVSLFASWLEAPAQTAYPQGVALDYSPAFITVQATYIDNFYYGISSSRSGTLLSLGNGSSGTSNNVALFATYGSVIAKSGTQPGGTESATEGGVIR